jgi:hypothetical protein
MCEIGLGPDAAKLDLIKFFWPKSQAFPAKNLEEKF